MIELGPSAIFALALQQLPKRLFHLRPLHGHNLLDLLALQQVEVILLAIQQLIQGNQLVPEENFDDLIFGQFRLDAYFVLGHEYLLGARPYGFLNILFLLQLGRIQIVKAVLAGHLVLAAP